MRTKYSNDGVWMGRERFDEISRHDRKHFNERLVTKCFSKSANALPSMVGKNPTYGVI